MKCSVFGSLWRARRRRRRRETARSARRAAGRRRTIGRRACGDKDAGRRRRGSDRCGHWLQCVEEGLNAAGDESAEEIRAAGEKATERSVGWRGAAGVVRGPDTSAETGGKKGRAAVWCSATARVEGGATVGVSEADMSAFVCDRGAVALVEITLNGADTATDDAYWLGIDASWRSDGVHASPVYGLKFHCFSGMYNSKGARRAAPLRGSKIHRPFGVPRGLAGGATLEDDERAFT